MVRDERGSTLVGELIALAIVGTALVALLSGLSTSSLGVRVVEHRVSAENVARSQMEEIKKAIEAQKAAGNMEAVAKLEVALQYFTNSGFRSWLENTTWNNQA